ncbi:MAG: hypothetical protein QG564_1561 [Campylobacterota bacterium]|nr:hypothetical protein [Campylobacterota bacterium]
MIHLLKKHPLWVLSNLLGLYLFAKMAEDVAEKEFIVVIDRWISIHMNTVQTPILNEFMIALTNINGAQGNFLITSFAIVFFVFKKWYKDLWFFMLSVGGAAFAFIIVKYMMQRIRPNAELIHVAGYAFPSGHSAMAMAMAAAFYFIFAQRVSSRVVWIPLLFACIVWPVMIGISRVYLDVHWLSDVIAGWGLGLFWVTLLALFLRGEKDI